MGFQQFIAYSSQFIAGGDQDSEHHTIYEQFCFTLIEIFDVCDDYLVSCFSNGSFKVPSDDSQFLQLLNGLIRANADEFVLQVIVARMITILGFQPFDVNNQVKFDHLIVYAVNLCHEDYAQLTVIPIVKVVFRLSLMQAKVQFNYQLISELV